LRGEPLPLRAVFARRTSSSPSGLCEENNSLQNPSISESMQLTAEGKGPSPRWIGLSSARDRLLFLQRAPRLVSGFRAEGVGK
jgi:hypothetical protein